MNAPVAPGDKQLVDLDLSKGMDERTRPELMGGITYICNMVQDQTGAWVKRPGTVTGPLLDQASPAAPLFPKRVLSLVTGWAAIGEYGKLLHYQDESNKLRVRQAHMDLSTVSAEFAGSSGPASQDLTVGPRIVGVASSSKFDCYINSALTFAGPGSLTIRERLTGAEVVCDMTSIVTGTAVKMVFVGDRYLHIFGTDNAAGEKVKVTVIDTAVALPRTVAAVAALTYTVVDHGAAVVALQDAVGGALYSYVLVAAGANRFVYQLTPAGAVFDTNTMTAAEAYSSMDLDESAGELWLLIASATASFCTLSAAGISTVVTATTVTTHPGTYICCDPTTHSQRFVYPVAATFGSSTYDTIQVWNLAAAGIDTTVVGAMWGWSIVSLPWFMSGSGKYYIQLVKRDTTNEIAQHAICDLSTFTGYVTNSAGLALPYGSFRIASILEPFSAMRKFGAKASATAAPRYRCETTTNVFEVSVCIPYQTAQRTNGVTFHHMRLADSASYGAANFSGATYLAHGGLNAYDGRNLVEQGFADMPVFVGDNQAVAGNVTGSVRYVAVYRHVDANGTSSYSRTYGPVAKTGLTGAGGIGKVLVTVHAHALTNRDTGDGNSVPFVELYRTANGGTQYYLCASSQALMSASTTPLVQQLAANATTGLLTVTDDLLDANLILQAIMYRQPGTPNAPADRYAAPACKHVIQHKDRLFCTDPYGQRVYYSSFFVDGEAAWFNPAFNFFVHAGSGPITALASMDGRLFVFKRDAIFVVDGDGPGEAGPSGNEYSPPQALASRYGCVDHRSVVCTPEGIVYRSTRGIEQISRNLKVTWLGERVQNTVNDHPVTVGSCLDPDGRVHLLLSETETWTGVSTSAGVELIYDLPADAWSVAKHTAGEVYGRSLQNVAVVMNNGLETVVYAESLSGVVIADATTGLDPYSAYIPWVVETGWIKQGPQARQRISGLLALCKKRSGANHAIRISLAFDYVDSYTQSLTWEPDVLNTLAIEELLLKPTKQLVLAIRLKIEEIIPSDTGTYPVGTGLGAELLGLTAEATPVHNAPFANRGVAGVITLPPAIAGISPASGTAGGGTAVTIYGTGFTAGTTFTLGGVALTSVVYVTSTQMTAVTPAGTSGAATLVASNAGGTASFVGWTYTAGGYDPAVLLATMWNRASYATVPWASTASAGPSGFHGPWDSLTSGPIVPAASAIGTSGYDAVDFDGLAPGVGTYLDRTNVNNETLFSPSAGGILCLFWADTADADTGFKSDNTCIFGGNSGTSPRICFSTSGVHGILYGGVLTENVVACTTAAWHLVMVRWDGVNLGVTLDSAAEATVACTASIHAPGTAMYLAVGYGAANNFDGKVAEIMTFQTTPTPAEYANFKAYCNTRYGLSL